MAPRSVALLALVALAGCSDDGRGPLPERGPDRAVADRGLDAAADLAGPDSALDAGRDGGRRELGTDGPADAKKDQPPDGPVTDGAQAPIYGTVSRAVAPLGDGKGELYVGLYLPGFPIQIAGTQLTADLSQPGSSVKYEIWGAPPGTNNLFVFLDDNGNATPFPFLLPDAGDLVLSKPLPVTVTAKPQKIDLVLDKVEGLAGDGGVPDGNKLGSLKGKVTATAAPALDGKGTLFISLHAQPPPGGQPVASTTVAGADLSSPYAAESYFLAQVPAGSYYLQVWLDDNANVNPFGPAPDKNDLVQSKPLQVHVVAGAMNVQDVVLDQVKP